MDKKEWIKIINDRQNYYVNKLHNCILTSDFKKEINFNSPTGTGKTIMISRLIDSFINDDFFFLITTLSKGGLNHQVLSSLKSHTINTNYLAYGTSSFTSNTILQGKDIINKLPTNKKIIWLRDEGHIKSNKWSEILYEKCFKIINISATNNKVDIQCNFTDTPLLRTPIQNYGEPLEAINCLIEVKNAHKNISHYNPCMIVRDISNELGEVFFKLAEKFNLKCIDITDNNIDMSLISKNDSPYDIIINKLKITEGIDIPRAHVIYIGNRPNNEATVIQLIGRVRRNALLWFEDVDIFNPDNQELLLQTTRCFIFYNKESTAIKTKDNELVMELSDTISVNDLIVDSINVKANKLDNGYKISELLLLDEEPYTGELKIGKKLGFNKILNIPKLYQRKKKTIKEYGTEFANIVQDEELVLISLDKCKYVRNGEIGEWIISKTVNDNIKYGKLFVFIKNKYNKEIEYYRSNYRHNELNKMSKISLDNPRANFFITLVLKQYFKYKLYGKKYLDPFYAESMLMFSNCSKNYSEIDVVLLAINFFNKEYFDYFYGNSVSRMIPNFSLEEILSLAPEIKQLIDQIVNKSVEKLKPLMTEYGLDNNLYCPHLGNNNILHGLVDIASKNFICLFSTYGRVNEEFIMKALAYHYLSTKRYDLTIEHVIAYDFYSQDIVDIKISSNNMTKLKYIEPIFTNENVFVNKNTNILNLKGCFKKFGKNITINLINKSLLSLEKNTLFKEKDDGKKVKIKQSEIIKQAIEIGDIDLINALLKNMKPSNDVLKGYIEISDADNVENLIKTIKPQKSDLIRSLEKNDIAIINMLKSKVTIDFDIIKFAIKNSNPEIVKEISKDFTFTKYMLNDCIDLCQHSMVTEILKKTKCTTYHIIKAIKHADIKMIKILYMNNPKAFSKKCKDLCKNAGLDLDFY